MSEKKTELNSQILKYATGL